MSKAIARTVETALRNARGLGVRIERGAVFDWCGSDGFRPVACNAFGALLILLDEQLEAAGPRRWGLVRKHLGVETYWEYRFHQGFDRHRLLERNVADKGESPVWVIDDVAKMGFDLSRKWCGA